MNAKHIPWYSGIRWRLALTYAGIALLAVLLLGIILIATLMRYYYGLERNYLRQNATAIADIFSKVEQANLPADVSQNTLQSLAFLSDTQIQYIDMQGNILQDTGLPQQQTQIFLSGPAVTSVQGEASAGFIISFNSGIPVGSLQVAPPVDQGNQVFSAEPYGFNVVRENALPGTDVIVAGGGDDSEIVKAISYRSNQRYRQPITSASGELAGYLELSNGPAYGHQIIHDVAVAAGVSGSLAVILAAMIGWLMSQRINRPIQDLLKTTTSMSQGDLSARAPEKGPGEFALLAGQFNKMACLIESKVKTLKRFVADAAHELNTPMTALRTYLDLAMDGYAGDGDEKVQLIQQARQQTDRLTQMMKSLLDLSVLEDTVESPQSQSINFGEILSEVIEPFASQAEQKGIEFRVEPWREDIWIPGHAAQLKVLARNLIENAVKFTLNGFVLISLQETEDEVILLVKDSGIGILDEELPLIFSRFHRGSNAVHTAGSGLGLAIVKAIADNHNAQIEVQSSLAGTCVRVVFRRFGLVS